MRLMAILAMTVVSGWKPEGGVSARPSSDLHGSPVYLLPLARPWSSSRESPSASSVPYTAASVPLATSLEA
jgi:hypothetical protein